MGRPRQHDEQTREALLTAAEQLIAEGGLNAISVRSVAERVPTTTRAVYALFGSKEGLVEALGRRAFELLIEHIDAVPLTEDPGEDLIAAGVRGFRAFATAHPDLFRLVLMGSPIPGVGTAVEAVAAGHAAWSRLTDRVARARAAGLLGNRDLDEVALQCHALSQGLATVELCGMVEGTQAERLWDQSLRAFLSGLGTADGPPTRSSTPRDP
jgi:AcrR family transcriptional regulator